MTISMNFSDNLTVDNGSGQQTATVFLNGSLSESKTFNINASIKDYDLFASNKEASVKKIHDFIDGVIEKVTSNCGNVVASTAETSGTTETVATGDTASTESGATK